MSDVEANQKENLHLKQEPKILKKLWPYIESLYNRKRIHGNIGYLTLDEYEKNVSCSSIIHRG